MKTSVLFIAALTVYQCSTAQIKQGKIIYERISQIQIKMAGMEQLSQSLPQSMTNRFEMDFTSQNALWKTLTEVNPDDFQASSGNSRIRLMGMGSSDLVYSDFKEGRSVEQNDLYDKKFLVDDEFKKLNWKLSEETKTVLNYTCRKATALDYTTQSVFKMNDGKMESSKVADTIEIVAWYTPDIPVPAGPRGYQGQLPGLIMELDVNNGKSVYKAIEISAKVDLAAIKKPTKGKKVTSDEFIKEREDMLKEMRGNGNMIRL